MNKNNLIEKILKTKLENLDCNHLIARAKDFLNKFSSEDLSLILDGLNNTPKLEELKKNKKLEEAFATLDKISKIVSSISNAKKSGVYEKNESLSNELYNDN